MCTRKSIGSGVLFLLTCAVATLSHAEQKSGHPWETEIRAFETADERQKPDEGAIVFVGSSTIRFWKTLAQDFPTHKVLNRGFGGCEIADCAYFAERIVVPYKPTLIILRAGGNDINAGKTPEQVRDDFRAFVEKVRAKLPKTPIAFMTINATPSRIRNIDREKKANQLIKDFITHGENLDYIDTFDATQDANGKPLEKYFVSDRLHFNAAGYSLLTERVNAYLDERLKTPPSSQETDNRVPSNGAAR